MLRVLTQHKHAAFGAGARRFTLLASNYNLALIANFFG